MEALGDLGVRSDRRSHEIRETWSEEISSHDKKRC